MGGWFNSSRSEVRQFLCRKGLNDLHSTEVFLLFASVFKNNKTRTEFSNMKIIQALKIFAVSHLGKSSGVQIIG